MSVFSIPHKNGCPECGRPTINFEGLHGCANKQCIRFGEVVR